MTGNNIFNNKNVQVLDSVNNWLDAVKIASRPLIDDGSIEKVYVENMIKSVEDNGPYMVLADYFALMHAKPGVGVNKMAMSLLVVKNPVNLDGKDVKIFLVMAAIDSSSHLKSLQKIMNIFMDDEAYKIILNGNKKTIVSLFENSGE